MIDPKDIHQDTMIDDDRFVALICDKDDLRGALDNKEIKLSEDEFDDLFDTIRRKMSDFVMPTFHECIEHYIGERNNDE